MPYSNQYIVGFAAGMCIFCSVFVSGSAVALKERQTANKILDRQKNVISVSGLVEDVGDISAEEIQTLFTEKIHPKLVNLQTGEVHDDSVEVSCESGETRTLTVQDYDQQKALKDPCLSEFAPAGNNAKLITVPHYGLLYEVVRDGEVDAFIIPVEGKGLWSTLYGFIALENDAETVRGLTFYQHAETPGLGGEVDNPKWKAQWGGKILHNDDGDYALQVAKAQARDQTHQVNGLSGATLTSRGVTYLLEYWLGENGFKSYLDTIREEA
jgi:Na+-transporting NADH:ubiquinone oxidoreductase subunit C